MEAKAIRLLAHPELYIYIHIYIPASNHDSSLRFLQKFLCVGILEAGSLAADIDDLTNVVFDLLGSQIFLDG